VAENKYVIFKLGSESYGLPIESVERILPTQSVTKIPKTPKMLLGVFELRGSTIPAIDARMRFEMPESEDARNFVVILTNEGRCALRVDYVDGIVGFEDEQVDAKSNLLEDNRDEMMCGIGKQGEALTVLLNPAHLVPKQLKARVAAAA
jgi:purine-binding chemotaxis protein CheW